MLGTNGGGFFNANSAHPFENPTPLTNFVQMVLDLRHPRGAHLHLRRMAGSARQGWAIFAAMARALPRGVAACYAAEAQPNPALARGSPSTSRRATWRARRRASASPASALFATVTTDASCGAVNAMHDSFTPLGGLVPLRQHPARRGDLRRRRRGPLRHAGDGRARGLHRRADGGPHAGVPGQEDRGARDEAGDALRPHLPAPRSSGFAAWAAVAPLRRRRRSTTPGPHGLLEILYAYTSGAGNNGSRLRRPQRQHAVLVHSRSASRCSSGASSMIIPVLAIAGSHGRQEDVPPGPGTFPTDGPLFAGAARRRRS